jgi:Putative auto-transporter adhesin, head GIN domain
MRIAAALVTALVLAACNVVADAQENGRESSGRMGQRSFDVGRFEGVAMGGAYDVVINVGPAHSVRAEGDEDELARMEVRVEDGDLHIGRKKGDRWSLGWRRGRRPVTVYVTTPALRSASIGGAGDMRIDALQVDQASFSIAGAGGISAVGRARSTDISIAGSGDMNLDGLESRTTDISIVGSGDVRARAVETADISIMGSGDVTLGGGAKCNVTKMGSGNVRCRA